MVKNLAKYECDKVMLLDGTLMAKKTAYRYMDSLLKVQEQAHGIVQQLYYMALSPKTWAITGEKSIHIAKKYKLIKFDKCNKSYYMSDECRKVVLNAGNSSLSGKFELVRPFMKKSEKKKILENDDDDATIIYDYNENITATTIVEDIEDQSK